MEVKDEKPVLATRDEAPASSLEAVFRAAAAAKQNGQLHGVQSDGQQIVLLQQSQLANYAAAAAAANPTAEVQHAGVSLETEIDAFDEQVRDKEELREQLTPTNLDQYLKDRFLPIANVARIMKRAIPESGKIAKDAKECVQECVSEFISFITSEASERCQQEKRKTINGEDILFAMTTLGFDNYVEPLKVYLTKYRESIKGEKLLELGNYVEVEETLLRQKAEVEDGTITHAIQYQVANSLHPSMVSSDGTYAYTQAQVSQLQGMHFSTG